MFTTDTISAVDWALTVKTSVSVWHRWWSRRPAEIKGRVAFFAWGEWRGEGGGGGREERGGVEDRGVGRGEVGRRGVGGGGGRERRERRVNGERWGGGGGARREGVWQHGADGLHKTMFAAFSFPPPAIRAVFN